MSRAWLPPALLVAAITAIGIGGCQAIEPGCQVTIAAVPADAAVQAGDPLPAAWPVLVGSGDVIVAQAAVGVDDDGNATVTMPVGPAAAERLGSFSGANVGALLAVALDARIASMPMIQAPIEDGVLVVSAPPEELDAFRRCLGLGNGP